ncbi:DUF6942 family protein [Marinobacterium mangrovicola]|uniref:Uncharacterized protein n=1 Tax=Marinobacterium mangrovicola TaxID=1476959 RepID=A0A4R1GWI6_9GAMM|nr:hypothetical protein [Marinobacterium mangrovicola]TCK08782.1 hypothetical protein CLV83_0875 [Marinobacterium mangrovicola]
MSISASQRLGTPAPRLSVYIPHEPASIDACIADTRITTLLAQNSNHWRKIVNLAAKVASPDDDWRSFRDAYFFNQVALVFAPELEQTDGWHWIGGKENQTRFGMTNLSASPLPGTDDLFVIPEQKLLLTPYPDYRQLSNQKVAMIREALETLGFYSVR